MFLLIDNYDSFTYNLVHYLGEMGAEVVVTEVDPFRALQARMDGYRVMPITEAAPVGDLFMTVTGNKHVLTTDHMKAMKDGAVLANAGHFDVEIDVAGLEELADSAEDVRPLFREYSLNGNSIFLCGEGRLVNLACAEGHPSTVMSLSFCDQALGVEWGIANADKLEPKVYRLPDNIDREVAGLQLEAMGIRIDDLTPEQSNYLSSWSEGT